MAGRLIPKNSVLMVSIGGSIGKAAIVDRDISCNQQINSVTPVPCIEPNFVLMAIKSSDFQTEVMRRAAQGTLPIISKAKWETIGIPIPPFNEQRRIVTKVRQLTTLVDQLDAELTALRAAATSIVTAVVGELSNNALAVEGRFVGFKLEEGARRFPNHGAELDFKTG
jgi:type I restriction enzyme S subunit